MAIRGDLRYLRFLRMHCAMTAMTIWVHLCDLCVAMGWLDQLVPSIRLSALGIRTPSRSPPAKRPPLVNDLGAANDVVALEARGSEAAVVGQDSEVGAGPESCGAGALDLSVLLRD